ncbi:F-box domain-containing protein [Mycena kentingensis (nom. inval.)]|nr:F-box domain-containing protein [Mycena kentingensis (nom. inval.)]
MDYTALDRATDRIRIPQLDIEIADLETTLAARRSERAAARKRLDAYSYPVLAMASEVISEIFLHCIPAYPRCPPLVGTESPTKLTQICRLWRQIAHLTPGLWRAISIARFPPRRRRSSYPAIAEAWLSRSGAMLLSIVLELPCVLDLQRAEIMALFLDHRARWQYLTLDLESEEQFLPDVFADSLPHLQELDLRTERDPDDGGPLSAIISSTFLRTAHLNLNALPGDRSQVILRSHNLSKLSLCATTMEVSPILSEAVNLVHIRLYLQSHDAGAGAPMSATLPRLETLIVNLHGESELPSTNRHQIKHFLHGISAPVLRRLYIEADLLESINEENQLHAVVSLVDSLASRCLQHLAVTYTRGGTLEEYQQALPDVANITVDGEDGSDLVDDDPDCWQAWELNQK